MNLTITEKGFKELKKYNKWAKENEEHIYNLTPVFPQENITEQIFPGLEIEKNEFKELWYKSEGSDWEQISNNKVIYNIDDFAIEFVLD